MTSSHRTTATNRDQTRGRRQRLLGWLADGSFHSGEQLAKRLRISRGGVWKLIRTLRAMGVDVESVPRQGYRLPRTVDLLDKDVIVEALSPQVRELISRLDVLLTVDSTNRFIVDNASDALARPQLCAAELQTAGRGRRGRTWLAPFGSGICMSIGWRFAESPPAFSALSLAVGVAAIKALQRFGASGIGLKWPNDLVAQGRKLGGILTEMRGESAGPAQVVIGIGINMRMPAATRLALAEQQSALVADVHELLHERTPTRNQLIAALLEEVVAMLQTFAQRGFDPFLEDWRRLDALANTPIKVMTGSDTTLGVARGVEGDGALLVDVDGQLRRFVSGDVSVRAAPRTSG